MNDYANRHRQRLIASLERSERRILFSAVAWTIVLFVIALTLIASVMT